MRPGTILILLFRGTMSLFCTKIPLPTHIQNTYTHTHTYVHKHYIYIQFKTSLANVILIAFPNVYIGHEFQFHFISQNLGLANLPSLEECNHCHLQDMRSVYLDPAHAKCQQSPSVEYCCGPSLYMLMTFQTTHSSAVEKQA